MAQIGQSADDKEAGYTQVITERSAKIVSSLGITDSEKTIRVRDIITRQYRQLNAIHDKKKAAIAAVKEQGKDKEFTDSALATIEATTNGNLDQLHQAYLAKLAEELSPGQVEMVKDGMTYRVLPITYNGYQQMLPGLTDAQKTQILAYLTEAREHAMDAESSEKKHAWFGKYKGKINNYLSASGIDMKKAGQEWEQRRKAAELDKKP